MEVGLSWSVRRRAVTCSVIAVLLAALGAVPASANTTQTDCAGLAAALHGAHSGDTLLLM